MYTQIHIYISSSIMIRLQFFCTCFVEEHQSFHNATTPELLDCSEDFYRENGSSVCVPSCHTWAVDSEDIATVLRVTVFISAVIGFLVSLMNIIISCLSYKRM